MKDYLPHDGAQGYVLGAIAFLIGLVLWGNRKYPAALFIILLGMAYALAWKMDLWNLARDIGWSTPALHVPRWNDVVTGFIILALPQIPLSIGNSILAARQTAQDLFPDRAPGLRKIGLTYSVMNLINPFFGGVPTCHGSGGLAGHYAFGARTGGSVVIYGALYLGLGLFFSRGFDNVAQAFPRPILGVILLFEGVALMLFIRDSAVVRKDFFIALLVGLAASSLPYGYLIGLGGELSSPDHAGGRISPGW